MPDDIQFRPEGEPTSAPAEAEPRTDATPAEAPGAWRRVEPRKVEGARTEKRRGAPIVWRVVAGVVGGLILLLVIFLWLFNWDWLRGPIGRMASAKMHREVRIDGHLRVHLLTWTPRIRVERIFVGQPDWAKGQRSQPFGTVESVTVDVKLMPLFHGHVDIPLVDIEKPNLVLLQDAAGRANWDFSDPNQKTPGKPFKLPPIQQFVINAGHIDVQSVPRKIRLTATVTSNERLSGGPAETFRLNGLGTINAKPFKLDVRGGPLINVRRDRPYPFDADVAAGDTHLTARGNIPKPFDLGHVRAALTITGRDLNDLYYLTGLALPNSPPYRVSGDLTRDEKFYDIKGLSGTIGKSDIGGHLSVDTAKKRPLLKAQLQSNRLDFADLGSLFGAPGASKAATGEQKAAAKSVTAGGARLLPDATLQVERIRAMDADVTYKATNIIASPQLPLRAVSIGAKLDDGLLKLNPITLTLPQGTLTGQATLNARGAVPATDVDVRLSNVQLETYIPAVGGSRPVDGTLAARVKLHGTGNSVHRAAASSDGRVTALIPGGHIRQAFAELLGIDATKGLFLLLGKDTHETNIRCALADFRVNGGVMTAERLLIDTGVVVVNGKGAISLRDETMNLEFIGKPTKFRLVRLNAPLTVGGRLNAPKFGIKPGGAITQAGVAVVLAAAVNPLLAILPFISTGSTPNADCGAVVQEAKTSAAPVSSAQIKPAAPRRSGRR